MNNPSLFKNTFGVLKNSPKEKKFTPREMKTSVMMIRLKVIGKSSLRLKCLGFLV
jgi:hypothetical protein